MLLSALRRRSEYAARIYKAKLSYNTYKPLQNMTNEEGVIFSRFNANNTEIPADERDAIPFIDFGLVLKQSVPDQQYQPCHRVRQSLRPLDELQHKV